MADQDAEIQNDNLPATSEDGTIRTTTEGDMVIGGFAFTPTGLVPVDPDNPPDFESWESVGNFLRYTHTGLQFWLGDWLNYGESNYGEKYAQAVGGTGYELHTLQTYAWIARQVPRANRHEAVPFGHYANSIAALPPEKQAEWVQRVVDKGMTQAELRDALTTAKAAAGEIPTDLWLVVKCKSQADFDKLEKQMRAQGREVTSRVTRRPKPKAEKKPKAAKGKKGGPVTQKPAGTPKKKAKAKALETDTKGSAKVVDAGEPVGPDSGEIDKGWLRDEFYIPPPAGGETDKQRAARRKKINNARFRARAKKGGGA